MATLPEQKGADFAPAKRLSLLPFPGENPHLHEAVKWWESTQARIAAAGLATTAAGGSPASSNSYVDVPLDSLPDLPSDHPQFERRRESRIRIQTQNAVNARRRYSIIMEGRTEIFSAFHMCAEETAPMFARELREACDYARYAVSGGYFDGTLAFRMAYQKLFAGERTKADREFYRAAEQLQRSSRLPDGCSSEEFMKKAFAWIYRIRPHLAQAYSDQDAAEYLVDLMPKRLAADARRIRGDCIRDGTFLNLMFLARELEKVVYDDQTTSSSTPALVVIPPDLVVHGADALSQMTGMSLRASGAASSTEVGLVGGTDGKKWCDRCPHPKGVVCFVDPAFKGPFPVFIHNNVERKKALLKKRPTTRAKRE